MINPQEPTNNDKCFECDDFFTCSGQCNKIEDKCAKEYEELGLKQLKELIEANRKTTPQIDDFFREPTAEERKAMAEYIESISIPTGVNAFDFMDEPQNDLIKRSDAIEAIEVIDWYHQNRNKDMVSGANSDEHQAWYKADDIYKALKAVPSVDKPQTESRK